MMTSFLRAASALAVSLALPAAATAQAAQPPCVTQAEAEALFLYMAPELIRQTGRTCAANLPAASLLRQTSGPLIAKFQGESRAAWPVARQAVSRLAGPEAQPILQSQFAEQVAASLIAPAITAGIQPGDCRYIDRIVTLIEPLPARNSAALIATLVQLGAEKDREAATRAPFRICQAAAATGTAR
jgi:hypothetical protein